MKGITSKAWSNPSMLQQDFCASSESITHDKKTFQEEAVLGENMLQKSIDTNSENTAQDPSKSCEKSGLLSQEGLASEKLVSTHQESESTVNLEETALPSLERGDLVAKKTLSEQSSCFQKVEISDVEESVNQSRVNHHTPKNLSSIRFLQESLLQSNFERTQSVTVGGCNTSNVSKEEAQLEFYEQQKARTTMVCSPLDIPSEWSRDTSFLVKLAKLSVVGLLGIPEVIRNRTEFVLACVAEGIECLASMFDIFTLLDQKVAAALASQSLFNYKCLPEPMRQFDEVNSAAVCHDPQAIEIIDEGKKGLELTREWLEMNPSLIGEYRNFSHEAKLDLEIAQQFVSYGHDEPPCLDDIPQELWNYPGLMSSLIEVAEGAHEIYARLSETLKSIKGVNQAFLKAKVRQYQWEMSSSVRKNQATTSVDEKSLKLSLFPRECREMIKKEVDGSRWEELQSGEKDGLVTSSELLAAMRKIIEASSCEGTDIETFQALESAWELVQSKGISMRVAGTEKGGKESTSCRSFDEVRLGQLQGLLESKIDPELQKRGTERVERANSTRIEHQAINDSLEMAVYGYTTSDYREINHALRCGEMTEEQQLYADGIAEGLRQMPSHKGIVWRVSRLPKEILELYEPGQEIVEKAFTSTSYEASSSFYGNVKFCIQLKDEGSAGKNIQHLSNFEEEKEVLINAGTRFRVLAKESQTVGYHSAKKELTHIYLQEM